MTRTYALRDLNGEPMGEGYEESPDERIPRPGTVHDMFRWPSGAPATAMLMRYIYIYYMSDKVIGPLLSQPMYITSHTPAVPNSGVTVTRRGGGGEFCGCQAKRKIPPPRRVPLRRLVEQAFEGGEPSRGGGGLTRLSTGGGREQVGAIFDKSNSTPRP